MAVGDAAADVVVVCGLVAETRIVRAAGIRTIAGGGRADTLVSSIDREIARGAAGLVSFGVCGALSSTLAPGTLILADAVVDDGVSWPTDVTWRAALARLAPEAVAGSIAGSDALVADVAAKDRLARASAAVGVDMESHVVARAARRAALPFVVVRAVADASDRALPPAAAVAMRADGTLDLFAVLRSIASSPRQVPALVAIGRDTRAATASLALLCRRAGARLAMPRG